MDKLETAITFPLPARREIPVENLQISPNPLFHKNRERRLGMGTHFAYLKLKNFIALSMNDGDMTFPSVCLTVPPTRCSIVSKRMH